MADQKQATSSVRRQPSGVPQPSGELESLASGSKSESLRQILAKPKVFVGIILAIAVLGVVLILQQDPSSLTLELPEAKYELLPNEFRTAGHPIAIHLGPLALFQISDPAAGGAGAMRAKQIVDSLNTAVEELRESPGRVITIDSDADEGMPRIVQKETSDAEAAFEIVSVTSDDMLLMETDNAKLLARVWAERLVDSLRLLIFAQPPEFSRDTEFGAALDTLYGNAIRESGSLTSDVLAATFEQLPAAQREALTSFPPLPDSADSLSGGG